ncbi:hypothetical protein RMATCC62417_18166 [Rhizopus microsporus]|nr:hypothetical protein RMATCC62417_18166 [Rhizopus microsporus]
MAPSATGKKNTSTPITDVLELPANQQIANAQNKPLGFKGNADVIQKVMNRTGTNIIASTNRSGTTTCLIQGQPADVARAKKELINGLLIKRVYSVDIPVSVRRFIIGPKGTTLRQIEEKSNTRINFARKEEEDFDENNPDDTIPLTIVGYVTDIMIAKEEIEKIVAEKRAKQTIKIDQFDAKYYPFIAGPHNSNIKKLEEEFDVKIHVPFIAIDGNNVNSSPITITGDKEKAQAAKQALEKNYVTIENTGNVVSITASKRQQKYLRGNSEIFKEVFNETGCTVELPSQDDPSENIAIRGPETQVVQALSLVMAKVKAVHISVLDLAQTYSSYGKDSLTYARYALKYLLDKRAFKGIEKEHNVQTSVPSNEELEKSVYVEFISKEEKDAVIAQLALTNTVRKLTPDRFSTIKIDAYLHQHILNTYRARIQRIEEAQQVDIIFPGEKDQDVLIVYEGDDKAAVKDALAAASAALKEIVSDSSDYVSKSLSIPVNYHDLIRGPKGTTLNAILGLNSGVTVRFGPNDTVEVRGFSKQVNHAISEINKAYQEAQDKNFAKPYSSEFSIPSNFSAHVIGKSGANINKLKEDFGVRIDFGDSDKTEEKVNGKDICSGA